MDKTLVCDTGTFSVYLTKFVGTKYVISVHEQFADHPIKKWLVIEKDGKWYLKNHQYKPGPITSMEYEWVTYPISWDVYDDLINDLTEITDNFTYFPCFPKRDV